MRKNGKLDNLDLDKTSEEVDRTLEILSSSKFLSPEERDVLKWALEFKRIEVRSLKIDSIIN